MRAAHDQMFFDKNWKCDSCSLRVRVSNKAAIGLYQNVLGYKIDGVDAKFYDDGEDANKMSIKLDRNYRIYGW